MLKAARNIRFTDQAVAPVHPEPPHCPYSGTVPTVVGLVMGDDEVEVFETLVGEVDVVEDLDVVEDVVPDVGGVVPDPPDPYRGGPGIG